MSRHSIVTALTALTLLVHAAVAGMDSQSMNSAVRMLRTAVTPQRDGSHLTLLLSLRQLDDPTLRPLFEQLLKQDDWAIQTHSVLGLAEISERGGVDPWLLTQVKPLAQEAVVTTSIERGLFDEEAQRQALRQDGIAPLARLLLLAESVRRGDQFSRDELRTLQDDDDTRVRALARVLLAQLGHHRPFQEWFAQHTESASQRERRRTAYWLLEIIGEYELDAVAPWIDEQFNDGYWRQDLEQFAIVTLMKVAPDRGTRRWRTHLASAASNENDGVEEGRDPSRSYRQRMQAAFMLLALTPDIPVDLLEEVEGDEALLISIVDAARAFARGSGAAEHMLELFARGHKRSMDWVVHAAQYLPEDEAVQVYVGVVDLMEESPIAASGYMSFVIPAIAELIKLSPQSVEERLLATARNSHSREVMLLSLFETSDPIVARMASELPRVGIGRADSMAFLLVAKHADALDDASVQHLGAIAAGGGRVSSVLRMQAAWLYLKHTDQIDAALARAFGDS